MWVWGLLAAVSAIVGATVGTLAAGIACALVGGIFIALASSAKGKKRNKEQEERDRAAREIAEVPHLERAAESPGVSAADEPAREPDLPKRFALFLRPFALTGELPVRNPNHVGVLSPSSNAEAGTIDFETILTEAFWEGTPLIGFGMPGETLGAGRIKVSDDDWQERLKGFAMSAATIFVIPATSEGTKWEVEWLRNEGLLAKCIFLLPPSQGSRGAAAWRAIEKALPIALPIFNSKGTIFSLNDAGVVSQSEKLDFSTTRNLVKSIKRVARSPISDMLKAKISEIPLVRVGAMILICYLVLSVVQCVGSTA